MSKGRSVSRVGSDERNIARLAPVLALNRVPADLTGWTKTTMLDTLGTITMSCSTSKGHVVPHGIDGDVIFALTTMFVHQGQPPEGVIEFNMSDLCKIVSLTPGKATYEGLRASLLRLFNVRYSVVESWVNFNRKGGTSVKSNHFGIIDNLKVHSEAEDWIPPTSDQAWQFQATTQMQVALNREIVGSIQSGYVRSVDLEFYGRLGPLSSRKLYLMIEEMRHNDPGREVFEFLLVAWGEHLGLREVTRAAADDGIPETRPLRPDKIRRAIDPAHTDLIRLNYLREVTYVGRGQEQTIQYRFTRTTDVQQVLADPEAVLLLTERGMAFGVAEGHVRRVGVPAIRLATRRFDARKAQGYEVRNPGGLLSDMLVNPDKYLGSETTSAPEAPVHRELKSGHRPVVDVQLAEPTAQERRKTAAFLVGNWRRGHHVTAEERQRLALLIESGSLDERHAEMLTRKSREEIQSFVRTLLG